MKLYHFILMQNYNILDLYMSTIDHLSSIHKNLIQNYAQAKAGLKQLHVLLNPHNPQFTCLCGKKTPDKMNEKKTLLYVTTAEPERM